MMAPATSRADRVGVALLTVGGLTGSAFGASWFSAAAGAAGLAALLVEAKRREAFVWVVAALAVAVLAWDGSEGRWVKAFSAAASYGALMVAISFVSVAARRSALRTWLRRQLKTVPRRGRDAAAYGMAHLAGAVLNLTGLVILAAAAAPGPQAAPGDPPASLLALHRGFALAPAWSPYSYFTPILLTSFPGAAWADLVGMAALFALPLLCIALATMPRSREGSEDRSSAAPGPASTSERLAIGCAASFCAVFVLAMTLLPVPAAALIHWLLPALTLAWAAVEGRAERDGGTLRADLTEHLLDRVPALRFEILALASAGLLSAALADVDLLALLHLTPASNDGPAAARALALFAVIVALMLVGVNPILFAGVAAGLAGAGLMPRPAAMAALVGAWALFPTLSPFAAANLVVAREARVDARALAFGANRTYNGAALAICAALVVAVAVLS